MKRASYLILLMLVMLLSCTNNSDKSLNGKNIVNIHFDNSIQGFNVDIVWMPNEIHYGFITGPAILYFNNLLDSSSFTIVNNNFGLKKDRLNIVYNKDSTKIIKIVSKTISLTYSTPIINTNGSFGSKSEPFFFYDINFDEKLELIVPEFYCGQRGVTSFKAYQLDGRGHYKTELYQITNKDPYRHLDEYSSIDEQNKQIIIYGSGGSCFSTKDFYQVLPSASKYDVPKFIHAASIEYNRDDILNKCFELKFEIVEKSKILISKTEVK